MLDHSPPLGTPASGRYHPEGSMLLDGGAGGGASGRRDPPGTLNLSSLISRQSPPRRHESTTSFEDMASGGDGGMGASLSTSSALLSIASRRVAGDLLLENAGSTAHDRLDMDRAKSMLRESYLEIERLQALADSVSVQLRESEFRRRVGEDKARGELDAVSGPQAAEILPSLSHAAHACRRSLSLSLSLSFIQRERERRRERERERLRVLESGTGIAGGTDEVDCVCVCMCVCVSHWRGIPSWRKGCGLQRSKARGPSTRWPSRKMSATGSRRRIGGCKRRRRSAR